MATDYLGTRFFHQSGEGEDGDLHLTNGKVYSFDNCIGIRVKCKSEECNTCEKRYPCLTERGAGEGVRFEITSRQAVIKLVEDKTQRRITRKHIKRTIRTIESCANILRNLGATETRLSAPSLWYPRIIEVDHWIT